jgi:cysteine desulfurase
MLANNVMKKSVYLDNAATTPIDKRVMEVMFQSMNSNFGNASSMHAFGVNAKETLTHSRETLAQFINAKSEEIIFTSGGTESNNLAIKGVAFANRQKGNHIIVSTIEHDCILETCKWLESQGFFITYLPVDSEGIVDMKLLGKFINKKTILVSVMHANNEIGTIQPIEEIGRLCKERNVLFHSDACQTFGKIHIDVNKYNIDLLTLNSHKIYGPKGVGAIYIRKGTDITPWLHGGGQEFGLRSSTENIASIAGFAKAAELSFDEIESESLREQKIRDKLIKELLEQFDNVYLHGHLTYRLANNVNFSFHGLEGETIRLLFMLNELGIAVSAGSACSSNHQSGGASHVLHAIGLDPFQARGSVRISLGRFNVEDDIDFLIKGLKLTISKLNSIFSV